MKKSFHSYISTYNNSEHSSKLIVCKDTHMHNGFFFYSSKKIQLFTEECPDGYQEEDNLNEMK